MVFMLFPCYCFDALRVSSFGGISFFALTPGASTWSLETLLRYVLHCLELIAPPTAFSVSLGMLVGKPLCPGTDPSLDCPHHLALNGAGLYSIGTH